MRQLRQRAFVAWAPLASLGGGGLARSQGTAGATPKELERTREQVIAEINQLPASLRPPLLSIPNRTSAIAPSDAWRR